MYYAFMTCLESLDSQRKGIVFVAYCLGPPQFEGKEALWHVGQMYTSLPFKPVAFHMCYDNPLFRPIVSFATMLQGKRSRLRRSIHYGKSFGLIYRYDCCVTPYQCLLNHFLLQQAVILNVITGLWHTVLIRRCFLFPSRVNKTYLTI